MAHSIISVQMLIYYLSTLQWTQHPQDTVKSDYLQNSERTLPAQAYRLGSRSWPVVFFLHVYQNSIYPLFHLHFWMSILWVKALKIQTYLLPALYWHCPTVFLLPLCYEVKCQSNFHFLLAIRLFTLFQIFWLTSALSKGNLVFWLRVQLWMQVDGDKSAQLLTIM